MPAELRPLIAEIASQADEFLAGTKDRGQARAGIAELLTMDHAYLGGPERVAVIAGVMAVLEAEDVFGIEFCGDAFDDADDVE